MKKLFWASIMALVMGNVVYANESTQRMIDVLQSPEVQEIVGRKGYVLVVSQASGDVSISLSNGLSNYPRSVGHQKFCLTFFRSGEIQKQEGYCYKD